MISPTRFTFLILALGFVLSGVSCEKHSWEETRKLHHHGDGHGEGEHGEGEHGHEAEKGDHGDKAH